MVSRHSYSRFKSATAVAVLCCLAGCTVSRTPIGKRGIDWNIGRKCRNWVEENVHFRDSSDDDGDESSFQSEIDSLWRQGYGYNNPNAERLRTGEPVTGWGD